MDKKTKIHQKSRNFDFFDPILVFFPLSTPPRTRFHMFLTGFGGLGGSHQLFWAYFGLIWPKKNPPLTLTRTPALPGPYSLPHPLHLLRDREVVRDREVLRDRGASREVQTGERDTGGGGGEGGRRVPWRSSRMCVGRTPTELQPKANPNPRPAGKC